MDSPRRPEDREPDAQADAERRPVVRGDVAEDEAQVVPVDERRRGGGGWSAQDVPVAVQAVVVHGRRGRDRGHREERKKKEERE